MEGRAVDRMREAEERLKKERLGPGGLDPLEVLESLPEKIRTAFEKQDTPLLKQSFGELPPEEAKYHFDRVVQSGLWVPAGGGEHSRFSVMAVRGGNWSFIDSFLKADSVHNFGLQMRRAPMRRTPTMRTTAVLEPLPPPMTLRECESTPWEGRLGNHPRSSKKIEYAARLFTCYNLPSCFALHLATARKKPTAVETHPLCRPLATPTRKWRPPLTTTRRPQPAI